MKTFYFLAGLFLANPLFSQTLKGKLGNAVDNLAKDSQFANAMISMVVLDGATGELIYEKNSQVGLAPASCQKVVTSVSAFEILGNSYRYRTVLGYDGKLSGDRLNGNIYITGYGDPTLGSWRWKETGEDAFMNRMTYELLKANIKKAETFIIDDATWGSATIPDGWVWEDIGNYYGAGCSAFNWHENQYDIILKPGKKAGNKVEVISPVAMDKMNLVNELSTGAPGTGDQAYVYYAPNSLVSFIRGTVPAGSDHFIIKASSPDPTGQFIKSLNGALKKKSVTVAAVKSVLEGNLLGEKNNGRMENMIYTNFSPSLDSINYWFLKKSVNLYGEAFVKTIAYEKSGSGSTDTGVNIIRDFWSKQGISKSALHIIDGSGLSPANRVTAAALAFVMQYAKNRPWFNSFYEALPEMNGMKMKDGYIGGVRSYTGYARSKAGKAFTFSFIVNNFDGDPGAVREKIWGILNLLK